MKVRSDIPRLARALRVSESTLVERTAVALFAESYVPSEHKDEIVAEHWPRVSQGVRDAQILRARSLLEAIATDDQR